MENLGHPLDVLPAETIIPIFCSLPNVQSVVAFGMISKKIHAILKKHEGVIARDLAITILGDDDPGVVKLAFITCYARFIVRRSTQGIQQFLKAYVHRNHWPSRLYQLRALAILPTINMGIELVEDWLATYGILWPVKLSFKCLTATESSRLRRHLYMLEAAVAVLEPMRNRIPEDEFLQLAKRYWETFSRFEVDAGWDLLWKLAPSHLTCARWSSCVARETGNYREQVPHLPYDELRPALGFIQLNNSHAPHWRHVSPLFTALKNSHEGERKAGCTQFTEPFFNDPSAFFTKEIADSALFKHGWGDLETHFRYQALQWNIFQRSYFMIGDKDRCEALIHNRGAWEWAAPASESMPSFNGLSIWHDDPVALGREGCVSADIVDP
ncbi:hypothetical protein F5Y05DRAFT_392767 [Hypoxylon sp. FL0543]|nr:hypothetical protein F5Y05DRAFT_392767 [Hypoxylon sp. FL0543]